MGWRKVRARALGEQTNGTNDALVLALLVEECGGFLVFVRLGMRVNG